MKIALGNDHAGYPLKEYVRTVLEDRGHQIIDRGAPSEEPVDFPDITWDTCDVVRRGEADRAVLVCGTGAGAVMAANKIAGIRCALGHDVRTSKRRARRRERNRHGRMGHWASDRR
jgi:ribose 5-phosphate isomerase B